jgi:hypothetical protein
LGVVVTDASNNPVEFIPVTFTAQSNGGATGNLPVTLAYSERPVDPVPGLAAVSPPFANGVAGAYTITASVGSLTAVFTEANNNSSNPVASLSVYGGSPQNTPANAAFTAPLQVSASDSSGNLLANVPVTFTVPSSGASAVLSAVTVNTGASTGIAGVTATANGIGGTYNASASAAGFTAPFTLTNIPGSNNILTAAGGTPQSTGTGTAFPIPLQVTLQNTYGVPLSGVTVTFSAPTSGASAALSSQTATTNSTGVASVTAIANSLVGSYSVTASAAAATGSSNTVTATFSLANVGVPASITATGGTPQSATLGTAFASPLQVTVRDINNNPLNGMTVSFTTPASGASASLSSVTALTNASGIASVSATANGTAGAYNVAATVGSLSAAFALTNMYSKCDIDQNGVTNVADVQHEINEALGLAPAVNDLNGDGVVNVADVQIVINAALGLGCTAR